MLKIGKGLNIILSACICFFVALTAHASFSVKTQLAQKQIGIEEDFVYSVVITSSKDIKAKIKDPIWPKAVEFSHSSVATQSKIEIINTSVSKTKIKSISYVLRAKQLGWFYLPSISIFANNKVYKTPAVKIQIVKEAAVKNKAPSHRVSPLDMFFNNNTLAPQHTKITNKDIFIKLEKTKSNLFLSEQFIVRYFLYSRVNISSVELLSLPRLKAFWKKDLEVKRQSAEQVRINGKLYHKSLIFSYLLLPLQLGKLKLDALSIKAQVLDTSGFGFRSGNITLKSPNSFVFVSKLPPTKKGRFFSGAIGDFQIQDKIKNLKIKKNKVFIWTINIQGLGNLNVFNLNNIQLKNNLELYDVQEKLEYFSSGVSKKKIELLLVAKVAGVISLPKIQLTAFNPYTKSYYYLSTKEKQIVVQNTNKQTGANNQHSINNQKHANKQQDKQTGVTENSPFSKGVKKNFFSFVDQIDAIKNKIKNKKINNFYFLNKYVLVFIFLLLLGFLVFIFFKRIREKKQSHLRVLKNKFIDIDTNILQQDPKKAARSFIDLSYWAVEQLKNKKYNFLSTKAMLSSLPLDYQSKYGKDLQKLLQDFEALAFSNTTAESLKKQITTFKHKLYELLKILLKYH